MNINNILFPLLLVLGIGGSSGYAQESINTSGGDAVGSGGTVAYSIGQTVYSFDSGSNGDVQQGVQQSYEIYLVGIEEEPSLISLNTFPNPTADYLTLEVGDLSNEVMKYEVMDLQGKTLLTGDITHAKTSIDLSRYGTGAYFMKISKESNELKTFKIIKN